MVGCMGLGLGYEACRHEWDDERHMDFGVFSVTCICLPRISNSFICSCGLALVTFSFEVFCSSWFIGMPVVSDRDRRAILLLLELLIFYSDCETIVMSKNNFLS
jgi:hypothetical protein